MKKTYQTSLFIFRRDLRLEDNTGLIFALKNSDYVIPAFIFTPEQIEHNPFRSDHCLKFMLESLQDLEQQLKEKKGYLYLFSGTAEAILSQCLSSLKIDAVIVNRDYTPYSQKRDEKLEKVCQAHQIPFHSIDDALLHPPEDTLKQNGQPYTVFTPYFRNASKLPIPSPAHNDGTQYFVKPISFAKDRSLLTDLLSKISVDTLLPGGRKAGLRLLERLTSLTPYALLRDYPAEACSSHLSAYLKFTVISPREVHAAICNQLGPHHELIRSLYWRDFFTSIAFFFPYVFQGAFRTKFNNVEWSHDKAQFRRWCEGKTGFPIVDAGMREMNATGFMHNRVRMIAASFLVKDLHIDWRWGEEYFAQTLIDYDPAVNNGNWQWVASTGCDAQPYFRIFNPWTQQKKFDPECRYIQQWIPELRHQPPILIHNWYLAKYRAQCSDYPPPMTDHAKAIVKTKSLYR